MGLCFVPHPVSHVLRKPLPPRLHDYPSEARTKSKCHSVSCTLRMFTIALPHVCGIFTTCCGGSQICGSEIVEALQMTSSCV